jgi:Lon protease-like protein
MEKYLPLFPLNLVVYPGEKLNLHIFEPRYKQLVKDAMEQGGRFGVPPFINSKISEFGTEVQIENIEKVYDDGRMDISTTGTQVFKLKVFENPAPNKLYAGGQVELQELNNTEDEKTRQSVIKQIERLFALLNVKLELDKEKMQLLSFELGHSLGLSLDQEYKLLKLQTEDARQQFLLRHLKRTIPVIKEMERTKTRVSMNGHFKHMDPLDF